jgi:hypothetical protein
MKEAMSVAASRNTHRFLPSSPNDHRHPEMEAFPSMRENAGMRDPLLFWQN